MYILENERAMLGALNVQQQSLSVRATQIIIQFDHHQLTVCCRVSPQARFFFCVFYVNQNHICVCDKKLFMHFSLLQPLFRHTTLTHS